MDCSPPGSSVHGVFQARTLEQVVISFSRGSSQGSNLHLLHCGWILYPLSHQGSLNPATERENKTENKKYEFKSRNLQREYTNSTSIKYGYIKYYICLSQHSTLKKRKKRKKKEEDDKGKDAYAESWRRKHLRISVDNNKWKSTIEAHQACKWFEKKHGRGKVLPCSENTTVALCGCNLVSEAGVLTGC